MPGPTRISFATCNLYNLNLPGKPIYSNTEGWSAAQYDKKLAWAGQQLATIGADVWGFQELWDAKAFKALAKAAGIDKTHALLVPNNHKGKIVCAAAVRKDILIGDHEWIDGFPDKFKLESGGDDAQTAPISVTLDRFSRPVLHFEVKPRSNGRRIHVYVAHFKSKGPTKVYREDWYKSDKAFYSPHASSIGGAISTIRRTAEASALRMLLTKQMRKTDVPVVVMGDLNDGEDSNTLNILTGQPTYLKGVLEGGTDVGLYSAGTLQQYRSRRDVYYTHIFKDNRESLDHILVSQEFYDKSKARLWAFDGLELFNDHLNRHDHKDTGTTDHAIVRAQFVYRPAK